MKENLKFPGLCAIALCSTLALAGDRPYRYESVHVENSRAAFAYGISPSGDVVGVFIDTGGKQHGFLLREGALTVIDAPGASHTDARGIAPDGTIVGTFRYPGEPGVVSRGYLRTPDGMFLPVNYPDHISTIAQRITPDGTIVGCYHDHDMMDSMRGVAIGRSGNSELDLYASMTNGSSPSGHLLVGLYFDMDVMPERQRAFMVEDGVISGFDYPGARSTGAWDVNVRGAIVGGYADGSGRAHGFLLENGDFTSFDFPGARATTAFGINARGDIVGRYIDMNGRTHAFLATRTAQHNEE